MVGNDVIHTTLQLSSILTDKRKFVCVNDNRIYPILPPSLHENNIKNNRNTSFQHEHDQEMMSKYQQKVYDFHKISAIISEFFNILFPHPSQV